jgi:methyltransferase family protein
MGLLRYPDPALWQARDYTCRSCSRPRELRKGGHPVVGRGRMSSDGGRRAWRNKVRAGATRVFRRAGRTLGYDTVPRNYYSPIPILEDVPERVWYEPNPMRGVDFDITRQADFLERELGRYVGEFSAPARDTGRPGEYYFENSFFGPVDAEVLYAMIRRFKPRRIVELGAGFSTLVAASAVRVNHREGHQTDYKAYDPYPSRVPAAGVPGLSSLEPLPATAVAVDELERLQENDILFVDTTHTVKVGSDVNYVVLEILPALAPGVIVHFHDVFLPYEYAREWVEKQDRYWAEQYLLQAFLAFNSAYEVLFGSYAVRRQLPERLGPLIASFGDDTWPLSLWLRRR